MKRFVGLASGILAMTAASGAWAYALNAHVAICQHALQEIEGINSANQGGPINPAAGPAAAAPNAQNPSQSAVAGGNGAGPVRPAETRPAVNIPGRPVAVGTGIRVPTIAENIRPVGGPRTQLEFDAIGKPDTTGSDETWYRRAGGVARQQTNRHAGVSEGPQANGQKVRFNLNAENVRIVLANREHFRGGCGAPDAWHFFGNTDPSHSYAWDPVTQYNVLWKHARTDAEKAWVLGWGAHLMMDANVHSFANTYAGRSAGDPSPSVWNTLEPKNFLGHVAAEVWINNYYIYSADDNNTRIATPEAFARKMFFDETSPIILHYNRLMEQWKPGTPGDVVTAIGGDKPGMLATAFMKLHKYLTDPATGAYARHKTQLAIWRGHEAYHRRNGDSGKAGLAAIIVEWHIGRLQKIQNVFNGWYTTTTNIHAVASKRGNMSPSLFSPFLNALEAYIQPDLVNVDQLCQNNRLPAALCAVRAGVKAVVDALMAPFKLIAAAVKEYVKDKIMEELQPLINVAMGRGLNQFFNGQNRAEAKALLDQAGFRHVDSSLDGNGAMRPKLTTGGIDGFDPNSSVPRDQQIRNNRFTLMQYAYYRNAFFGVLAILENRNSITGLPSADFTNAIRCTQFFQNRTGDRQYASIMKGERTHWYNASTEICHRPIHTSMRTDDFAQKATYPEITPSANGFEISGLVSQVAADLVNRAKQVAGPIVNTIVSSISGFFNDVWRGFTNLVHRGHSGSAEEGASPTACRNAGGSTRCTLGHAGDLAVQTSNQVKQAGVNKITQFFTQMQPSLNGLNAAQKREVLGSGYQTIKARLLSESDRIRGQARNAIGDWYTISSSNTAKTKFDYVYGDRTGDLGAYFDAQYNSRIGN